MKIRNTVTDPTSPYLVLLSGMDGDGGSRAIEAMEQAGQTQLMHSDRLPSNGNNGDPDSVDDEYLALGFTFGEPDADDPMFRPATLPNGWKREASDHSMWSFIVDELGRRRVSIFYKAAFYDRHAFMRLNEPAGYFFGLMCDKGEPVLDGTWITTEVALAELATIRDKESERATQSADRAKERPDQEYWQEYADGHAANVAWAEALIQRLGQA